MAEQGKDSHGASTPDGGDKGHEAYRGNLSRPKPQGIISFNKKAQIFAVAGFAVIFALLMYGISLTPASKTGEGSDPILSKEKTGNSKNEAKAIKDMIPEAPILPKRVEVVSTDSGDGGIGKDWFDDVKGQERKADSTPPPVTQTPPPTSPPPVEVPSIQPPVAIQPPPAPPVEDPAIAARRAADKAAAQAATGMTGGAGAPAPQEKPALGNEGGNEADQLAKQRLAFVRSATSNITSNYISSMPTAPISSYEVKAGWLIPAVLEHAVSTELSGTGMMTARVSQNVYDTVTGNYLLIPQGARLVGQFGSVAVGNVGATQDRLMVAWERIIFPDGSSINLSSQPSVDAEGYAGLHDKVNQHWGRVVMGAFLTSVFSSIPIYMANFAQPPAIVQGGGTTTTYQDPKSQAIQNLGNQLSSMGQNLAQRFLSTQPSVEIRPGYRFYIRVQKDLAFLRPYEFGGVEQASVALDGEGGLEAMKAMQPAPASSAPLPNNNFSASNGNGGMPSGSQPSAAIVPQNSSPSTNNSYGGAAAKGRIR